MRKLALFCVIVTMQMTIRLVGVKSSCSHALWPTAARGCQFLHQEASENNAYPPLINFHLHLEIVISVSGL